MVGTADVDVGEGVGEVEEFVRDAQIGNGFPYEKWLFYPWVDGFAFTEDGSYQLDTAFWVAYQVETL